MGRVGVGFEQLADLFEQLSRLLQADSDLATALEVLQGGWESPAMEHLVAAIHAEVKQGQPLSAALSSRPESCPPFLVQLVAEAEREGQLPAALAECSAYLRELGHYAPGEGSSLRRTLFYPLFVLLVIITVSSLLLVFVIPQFEQIFANFGVALPSLTLAVIAVANALKAFWPLLLLLLVLLVILWRWGLRRSAALQALAIGLLLRVPGYRTLYRRATAALLLNTWGVLMKRGRGLSEALAASAQLPLGPHLQRLLLGYAQALQHGERLDELLHRNALFAPRMVQLIRVCGRIKQPHELMLRQSQNYARQLERQRKNIAQLQEALLVLVAGVLVGTLVIAMYLPIFMLGEVI